MTNRFFLLIGVFLLLTSCSTKKHLATHHFDREEAYPEFTEADSLIGTLSRYRSSFDVYYYDLDLEVDIENQFLDGEVAIHFTAVDDLDTIQIDLYENLAIDGIYYGADSLRHHRKHNAVFIEFDNTIRKGQDVVLEVRYSGHPVEAPRPPWYGGMVWEEDKDHNPWVGVACEGSGPSIWWPVKDHLSDEPDSVRLEVTIPEGLFCVSNGKLVNQTNGNNTTTFTWKTQYPINSYNVTLYLGNYEYFTIPYEAEDTIYDLDFYVLPRNLEKAKEHFRQTVDVIRFFEETFGEYPWWREGFKLVESPYRGMEHQTAIAYGDRYKNRKFLGFDHIIVHEAAHEWWGNAVSVSDFAEIWLHEGFATYSEALYVEHTKGYEAYLEYIERKTWRINDEKPVVGPHHVNYWDKTDNDPYNKGALILHTLRNAINSDTVFFDILKSFYSRHKYSIVSTEDFIAVVNEKTGDDYKWFFDHYLYKNVSPHLTWKYYFNEENFRYELLYRWEFTDDNFRLPVTIQRLNGKISRILPENQLKRVLGLTGKDIRINPDQSYIFLREDKDL